MPFVQVGTEREQPVQLHYQDEGEGAPVVLIHGWPLSGAMWEYQVPALLDAGHRVIAYDRRGFGQSTKVAGGYDYDTFAADLDQLIRALDLNDVTLVGFSMGGGEVARYLGRYGSARISKAVLLGAVTPFLLQTDDNPEGVPGSVFDGMIEGLRENRVDFLDGFLQKFFNRDRQPDILSDEVVAFNKSIAWAASPTGTVQCVRAFGSTDFRDDLQRFDVPTLVVHGDGDQIVPLEVSGQRTAQMVEGAQLEVIEGAPHGFNLTHPQRLNELLVKFITSA